LSFEDFLKMISDLKISACIPPLRNMGPPPIFTVNQSIPFHFFSSNIIKPPSPQETEHRERERGRKSIEKRERKASRISSNKRGS
jgi:hypothetical protein